MTALQHVPCRLDGEIVFPALSAKILELLRLRLALPNPRYVKLRRFGIPTGTEPETIETLIEMPDGSAHVPRGCTELLLYQMAKYGLAPKMTEDARTRGEPLTPPPAGSAVFVPRDYQAEAIATFQAKRQGLVILPCGCGKTKLGVGAILAIGRTALVLVHTTDLADQWLTDLRAFGLDAGLVGDGRCETDREVVVGILGSILPLLERDPTFGQRFGVVLVDEAHHAPASTFQKVLRLLPALYRLGLTATPEREDGLTKLITWSFGRTLLERTTREMIHLGFLMPAKIEIIETGFRWEYDGPEKKRLAALETAVATDLARNLLIAERVVAKALEGKPCLVLCRTREHTRELAELITLRGVEARHVTSLLSKKKRKGSISDLREGRLLVVCATSLADEGLDLPRLAVIALASPQRAKGATIQRLGRLLRLWDKKPELLDFVDSEIETLASRATARRKVYREAGLLRDAFVGN